jgi:hypothetical protein
MKRTHFATLVYFNKTAEENIKRLLFSCHSILNDLMHDF